MTMVKRKFVLNCIVSVLLIFALIVTIIQTINNVSWYGVIASIIASYSIIPEVMYLYTERKRYLSLKERYYEIKEQENSEKECSRWNLEEG